MPDDASTRSPGWHATTILMVRKDGRVVIGGDGQVSIGQPSSRRTPARSGD